MRRGIALVSTLLLATVLLVMVLGMVTLARHQSFRAVDHANRLAALYVAESGLAAALDQLSQSSGWIDGFQSEPTVSGRGVFSVTFNTTGANFQATDSVNNLDGTGAVDGPRGFLSVPAHSALIVVVGRAGGSERIVEAIVSRGLSVSTPGPLASNDLIRLEGSLEVSGIESLESLNPVEAGIHSNRASGPGATIEWNPLLPTDRARVTGKVSSVDPSGSAIDFGGDPSLYSTAGFELGVDRRAMPNLDIPATVAAQRSATVPTLTPGTTTLPPGKYYLSGLSYQGDLVLQDGAELYVEGDFDVNGAVRGEGSIYVTGSTRLRGDTAVNGQQKMALLSHGDVSLEGFNGTAYLKSLPGAAPMLSDVNGILDRIVYHLDNPTDLSTGPYTATKAYTSLFGNGQILDNLKHHLGNTSAMAMDPVAAAPWKYAADMDFNRIGTMVTLLESQPDSETKAFLVEKLAGYREFANNENGRTLAQKQANVQAFLDSGQLLPYAMEEFTDLWGAGQLPPGYDIDKAHALIRSHIAAVSYDKLGNSYFQGLVYSNGSISANNQISVVGALVCNGQLTLGNGTSVTYVEDFFSGTNPLVMAGGTSLRTWVAR